VRGRIYNLVSRPSTAAYTVTLVPSKSSQWFSLPERDTLADAPDRSFAIRDALPGSYTLIAFWSDEGRRYMHFRNLRLEMPTWMGLISRSRRAPGSRGT
jgi:hypothetical protein